MAKEENNPHPFRLWVNLAQPRLGARVVYASDDFFADKARMIEPQDPVFIAGKYDDHGKWMDGWETRRKRGLGHDYAILRLGVPGIVKGFDIDTRHFTGNYAPSASIDACVSDQEIPGDEAVWEEILPSVLLSGDSHHLFPVADRGPYTHLRLNIYPDGGVARLRVFGMVVPDLEALRSRESVDLVALEVGGRALVCNDEHFGTMHNLIAPGRGVDMGDGWETRRRREPGNDWVILALGHPGSVKRILIDTAHFKGNFPDGASVQAAYVSGGSVDAIATQSLFWETLLPEVKLGMDQEHEYRNEVRDLGPITHVRLNIFPDGGVSRIRLFGRLEAAERVTNVELWAQPLCREAFAPFGDVIETDGAQHFSINAGTIERFHDLATVDVGVEGGGRALISLVRCNQVSELPYEIPFVERHPLGSQAFIPLDDTPLVVVVAPVGDTVDVREVRAFISNGRQGVNYHRGVWHIPLIAFKEGQQHLVVDRGGPGQNCDEFRFPEHRIVVTA